MSTTKLLCHKRENKLIPELDPESKEDSTQSSYHDCGKDIQYLHYSPTNIIFFHDNWTSKEKAEPKKKLGDKIFEIKRYFNFDSKKIEKLLPFKSKSINFNELLKNEKEYLYHFLVMKNYSINELKQINLMKKIPEKKFHMILDIDSTMVKAVEKNDIPQPRKPDDFEISGSIDIMNKFEFYCRYRPYLFHFIHEIKDYFNFYISTLGHINYASKIIEDLRKKAEISIPQINIISNKIPGHKLVKSLDEITPIANYREELDATVIIDDMVNYWIKPPNVTKQEDELKQCIKCLIPSRRYVIQSPKGPDTDKFGVLLHNNIFEDSYKKDLNYSIPIDYSLCIEKDSDSENGKKGQFFYLEMFMKKCIKFCLYTGKPLVEVMDFFRKKIFEGCKFNLKYLDSAWAIAISNVVSELGGDIVVDLDETTHFIINDKINKEKTTWLRKNQNLVNINYIFQCYFNLFRMNELENQVFA